MLRATGRLQAVQKQLDPRSDARASVDGASGSKRLSKVRLAFIGCGTICHAHLNGLNALAADLIQVTVCIDPSERAKEVALLVSETEAGAGSTPKIFVSHHLSEAAAAAAAAAAPPPPPPPPPLLLLVCVMP
jgi:hypothetical protein